jgi:hypothetical protein
VLGGRSLLISSIDRSLSSRIGRRSSRLSTSLVICRSPERGISLNELGSSRSTSVYGVCVLYLGRTSSTGEMAL